MKNFIMLVIISGILGLVGFMAAPPVSKGMALIGGAGLIAICARMLQASIYHSELIEKLEKRR